MVEKPIVATLPQIEKLKALLAQPGAADRVLALDHWMARLDSVKQSLVAHISDIVKIEGFCRSQAGITPKESPLRSTSPPASQTRERFAIQMV